MPAPMTEMQERFAVEFAMNGGDATAAAIAAGYSEKSACDIGRRTLALPHIQVAVLRELTKLRFRSGAIGLNAMIQVATNEKAPAAARVSAARSLMEHAGMVGTAKEMEDARNSADGKVIDYMAVLDALGRLSRGPDNDQSPDELKEEAA
jgi:phage terminase small subunit